MDPILYNPTADEAYESIRSSYIEPTVQQYRQYGNTSVYGGTGLTVVGDIYNSGTLSVAQTKSDEIAKFGPCLGSAPQLDSAYFVGREAEIEQISHSLRPGKKCTKQRRVVLGGIGGIGKTQLAITYAERYQNCYDSVFWLNATSQLTLQDDLRLLVGRLLPASEVEKLNDKQVLARVHEWLSLPKNTHWLLIFDNYDEPEQYSIGNYCPYTAHGSVIVTTRLPDYVHLSGDQIRVQPLADVEEGLRLLSRRSRRENVLNDQYARRLVQRLGGLPLALATTGAYLSTSPSMTFQQYVNLYEERWCLDPQRSLELQEYQERTLYTTWDVSYARLKKADPVAAQLLKLLAYFDNQQLWYELFSVFTTRMLASPSPKSLDLLQSSLLNQVCFDGAMRTLIQYCFIEAQNTLQSYSMHNYVHDWTLARLNENLDPQLYWYAFDCVGANIKFNDCPSLANQKYARIALHAVRLVHPLFLQDGLLRDIEVDRISEAGNMALILKHQSQYMAAEVMYRRVITGTQKALGLDHVFILNALNNLGKLYEEQGKFVEAEQTYMQALARQAKALGPNHNSTLSTVNNLGILYYRQGKLDKAEQIYLRAIAGREKTLGPHHVSTLETVGNLGVLYSDQGKLDKAEQMLLRVLIGGEKVLGLDHISVLNTLNNLGVLYCRQGKFDKAEKTYLRALAGLRKELGLDHSSTRRTAENLIGLHHWQRRTGEEVLP